MAHHNVLLLAILSSFIFLATIFAIIMNSIETKRHCGAGNGNWAITVAIYVTSLLGSLGGVIGACRKVSWPIRVYLFGAVVLSVLLLISSTLGFRSLVNKDHGNWEPRKLCLQNLEMCQFLDGTKLTPMQNGCCKPPMSCGFASQNATVRNSSKKSPDCEAWSKDRNKLCFDCDSCRTEFLVLRESVVKVISIMKVVHIALVVIAYYLGLYALRSIVDMEGKGSLKDPPYALFPNLP